MYVCMYVSMHIRVSTSMLDNPQSLTVLTAILEVEVSETTRFFIHEFTGMVMHSSLSPPTTADSRFIERLSAYSMYVCMYVCMLIFLHVCMYVCMYTLISGGPIGYWLD